MRDCYYGRMIFRFLSNPRINLSPSAKDFRGEEHYSESIQQFRGHVTEAVLSTADVQSASCQNPINQSSAGAQSARATFVTCLNGGVGVAKSKMWGEQQAELIYIYIYIYIYKRIWRRKYSTARVISSCQAS